MDKVSANGQKLEQDMVVELKLSRSSTMFDSQHDVLSHLEGQKFLGEVVNGRLVLTPLKAEALVSDAKETAIETLLETLYLQQGHDAVLSELARLSRQWAVVPQDSAEVNDE